MTTLTQNEHLDRQKKEKEKIVYSFLSFVGPVLSQNLEAGGRTGMLGGQGEGGREAGKADSRETGKGRGREGWSPREAAKREARKLRASRRGSQTLTQP